MTVGIIGAGISGLTLAYELQQLGIAYHLWEADSQPGGYIQSRWESSKTPAGIINGPYLCELGPNSLLGDANLLHWIDTLGLTPELSLSKPISKARYIFRDGMYKKLPSDPPSLFFGNFFSWKAKLAIFRERTNKTIHPDGETLSIFFRRRFCQEIIDYALGPFVAGIYAGDPEQLLVSETFPILLQYEKEYGSVVRGLIQNQLGMGRRQSFSFRNGMQTLPNTLAATLINLSLNNPVNHIRKLANGWQVTAKSGTQTVDKLVLAVGTNTAAQLIDFHYKKLANALRSVTYPPMTVVHSAYKRTHVEHPLNGFGALNPKIENQYSAGHIWSSSIFDGRCPTDEVLVTTLVGGQTGVSNARHTDSVLSENVHRELATNFGIKAIEPVFQRIQRWERSIPQYNATILSIKSPIREIEVDQLFVCANWYGGVSLSDCIQKAQKLARQLTNA
ncbi:protoporphyrinogen oxidase [Spirosoma sp. KCTC 42546]|uniref:protoporphyrinogen oxidase n=1 Tax=Spirosoma sp. KCTC 42546 TaxID=2520506 RepID=UPI00115A2E86|nr:protoporphyrinogen oxidase [Spirosoma sp. KCTC 42546]QDK83036.1 protoporphyrinogen oxidase [Spirosoma sp. KCTC 42546]